MSIDSWISGYRVRNSASRGARTCRTYGTGAFTRNGPAGACPLAAISCRASLRSKISRASARTAEPSGVISMDRVVRRRSVTFSCSSSRVTDRLRVEADTPLRRADSAKPPSSTIPTKAAKSPMRSNSCSFCNDPFQTCLFSQQIAAGIYGVDIKFVGENRCHLPFGR